MSAPREVWEYKPVFFHPENTSKEMIEEKLNVLGAKGWELVSGGASSVAIMYTFKRRKVAKGI